MTRFYRTLTTVKCDRCGERGPETEVSESTVLPAGHVPVLPAGWIKLRTTPTHTDTRHLCPLCRRDFENFMSPGAMPGEVQ